MRTPIRCSLLIPRLLALGIAVLMAPGASCAAPRSAARNVPSAPAVSDAERAALAGPWKGTWTGNRFGYKAVMTLAVGADGAVDGSINWTLSAVPDSKAEHLIGLTGIENVRGTYNPAAAILSLAGYSKADPNGVVELDQYLLVVSPTRQTMGGITAEHGGWTGQFFLSR